LVLKRIEELEADGGVEKAGRALVDGTGIWADLEVSCLAGGWVVVE
jgi:hypothetical protein